MDGQLTLWELPEKQESVCKRCYYECLGKCVCWHSKYEDMDVPQNGCDYFDGVDGGIDI